HSVSALVDRLAAGFGCHLLGASGLGMTQPAKGQEPSMEEILASIRRIIADDPVRTARHEQEDRKEGQSGSPPPAQVNASVPKESRPATEPEKMPIVSPLRALESQANEGALPPMAEVASI